MSFYNEGFIPAFLETARRDPTRTFATFDSEVLDFATLEKMSACFAAALRDLGIRPGARVAVMMANSTQTLPVLLGLARAAITWVPLNARLKGDGLAYILEHSDPEAVVCDADLVASIRGAGVAVGKLIIAGDPDAELSLGRLLSGDASFDVPPPDADGLFAIMYTSGTTGRPKGVMVTHGMMRLAGEAVAEMIEAMPGDVLFVWEPLYHIGGAQTLVLPAIRDVSLAMVKRFSASRFWEEVCVSGATQIHYLGGVLQILLKQQPSRFEKAHKVRFAWGAAARAEDWPVIEDRFGLRLRECYGMTEASSVTTVNMAGIPGAVGTPMPWFTVSIRDRNGTAVPEGERGEIVVSTSIEGAIFKGYFRNVEATAHALRENRLHTGDQGSVGADGQLRYLGRLTDSVRCRGENVSAFEVESVASMHPDVEACAMIGVVADIGEQDIKLFVQPKSGSRIDLASFSDWLSQRLAPYQNPRYLVSIEAFELTPSERIMKHRLPSDVAGCFDRLAPVADVASSA